MEAMGKSLLQSSLLQDITKDDIEKGLDQLKLRFVKKMEPISCKLEVVHQIFSPYEVFTYLFAEISTGCCAKYS